MRKAPKILAISMAVLSAALAVSAQPPPMTAPKVERAMGPVVSFADMLSAADRRIRQGQAEAVYAELQKNLLRYDSNDLGLAWHLSGKCLAAMADKAQGEPAAALRRQAALDFMRSATFFPYAATAGESLLQAGRQLAKAGETEPAKSAYRAAIGRYAQAAAAREAQEELAALATGD